MLDALGTRCTKVRKRDKGKGSYDKFHTSNSLTENFPISTKFSWYQYNPHLNCVYEVDYFDGKLQASEISEVKTFLLVYNVARYNYH